MKTRTSVAFALLAATLSAQQQESLSQLRARFEAATQEYRSKAAAAAKAWERAKEAGTATSAPDYPPQPYRSFYEAFRRHADKGAVDAKLWVIKHHRFSDLPKAKAHLDKRKLVLECLAAATDDAAIERVDMALRLDGFDDIPRREALSLHRLMVEMARSAASKTTMSLREAWSLDNEGADLDERADALKLYERIARRWPKTHAGKKAKAIVVDARTTQIGQRAPALHGTAATGEAISLAKRRGQVAVIYFWGFE